MKLITKSIGALTGLAILAGLGTMEPYPARAQWGWGYPGITTPDAQRNALNNLRSNVNFFENATRTAPNIVYGGAGTVWQQFQNLRVAYNSFKGTLTPGQLNYGANDLADLEAGLDILQEAFGNFQADVAAGQSEQYALRNLCQVLRRAVHVWLQELNRDCQRLRVGW